MIPAYNAESTLPVCLKSLATQSWKNYEVIVVDDHSTDQTAAVARGNAEVAVNRRTKGAGGARNTGADIARGDIIAFVDADCAVPVDWLEKITKAFDANEIGAVAGGYCGVLSTALTAQFAFLELRTRRKNFPEFVATALSNNLAVRRELFHRVGGFPEIFRGATLEDMLLTFKISRVAKIRWLKDNGVRHHFPQSLRGYLRQQFAFGRDTVVAYGTTPALFQIKTHQGRALYFEILLTGLAVAMTLLRSWPAVAVFVAVIFLSNFPLLRDCRRAEGWRLSIWAVVLILLRNLVVSFSLVYGLGVLLQQNLTGQRRAKTACS